VRRRRDGGTATSHHGDTESTEIHGERQGKGTAEKGNGGEGETEGRQRLTTETRRAQRCTENGKARERREDKDETARRRGGATAEKERRRDGGTATSHHGDTESTEMQGERQGKGTAERTKARRQDGGEG